VENITVETGLTMSAFEKLLNFFYTGRLLFNSVGDCVSIACWTDLFRLKESKQSILQNTVIKYLKQYNPEKLIEEIQLHSTMQDIQKLIEVPYLQGLIPENLKLISKEKNKEYS